MSREKILTLEDVIEIASYLKDDDINLIRHAFEYAYKAHENQYRRSGEPYIIHPVQVASILAKLGLDAETIASGFLHDVVEDTDKTIIDIEEEFNEEIAMLVDGVTKLGKIQYKSQEEQQAENHRKMFIAMSKDIRVILIKLADRVHNMRTLKYLPPEKQRRIANETLEIFAPLAHRLGISAIKWELEDVALRYLNPQQYYRIVNLMQQKREERESHIEEVMVEVQNQLENVGIKADFSGRPKHIYSIYRKMMLQNKQFNEIYDLLAVRIIVDSIKDCYAVLGIIHTCWKPMPGRFKDYIAMPKPNLYQSLHTTVIGPKGAPLEVQIRTKDMHEIAEYGIAAHWAYKEGKSAKPGKDNPEEKLAWFREILESQSETNDAEEFMESLKVELFADMVYVFTPKGDVIELPKGSIPIDFAYKIHTEVGNHTIGTRVNGKMEPLDYQLKNGDIIEVLTSKHSYGPSRDWLNMTQTSQARNKIKQFFKKQQREENVVKGKEMIEKEIRNMGYELKDVLTEENMQRVTERFNFMSIDDMMAAVGYQGITASQIATRLTDKLREQKKDLSSSLDQVKKKTVAKSSRRKETGIIVEGVDNLLVRLAKCCNPVPGDEVIGYITKGRGVSVHRKNCPNLNDDDIRDRLLEVRWETGESETKQYQVDLEISAYDRRGLLNDILQTVNELGTNIVGVQGKTDRNKIAMIHLSILINDINHLKQAVGQIKQIKDVYTVERVVQ
ncbi:MAG TPA: bifunctional (p)ppGpp synthetase/guanosine-3',5'-bis(diphosphate) 3'-pyrophosphohydrolase [Bacilli bacterium]|nr:bifunctional (p)ppGpp synthetase/guanosine-3',5'-bis(diphosphate) 3'-pyrophosphohydrolase [Bacilli bacterium]